MKLLEYFLYAKKTSNNDFIQRFVSSASPSRNFAEYPLNASD